MDGSPDQMPYNELLLWSVLCNMQQMARFMWERGDENMARALVAGKLYNVMARLTKHDDAKADVTNELKAHAEWVLLIWSVLRSQCTGDTCYAVGAVTNIRICMGIQRINSSTDKLNIFRNKMLYFVSIVYFLLSCDDFSLFEGHHIYCISSTYMNINSYLLIRTIFFRWNSSRV